jgi:hypothetical protein
MNTTARSNRVYDHRLKALVHHTGDIRLDERVPRSTARGWLRQPPQDVVTLDIFERQEQELLEEVERLASASAPTVRSTSRRRARSMSSRNFLERRRLRMVLSL